jgi:hypothetical protein
MTPMINSTDDAMPARCQSCVPDVDCVFWLAVWLDDEADAGGKDECACPERARLIACDVSDAAYFILRHVNLNDRAAIEAALLEQPLIDFVESAIEEGRLDDFIERAVECAKAQVEVKP